MPKPVLSVGPRFFKGDLWEFHKRGYWTCVTTNIGWRANGTNVMGAGVAKEATVRYPSLPEWYGNLCRKYKEKVGICIYNPGRLIMLPTKELNRKKPWLSWQSDSSLELIEQSIQQLVEAVNEERLNRIALSYPGCGNGNLSPKTVKPILLRYLDDRFSVVRLP